MTIDEWIEKKMAEGYEVVQQGAVRAPFDALTPFVERVNGCTLAIRSGDWLHDDDERWVHMRRTGG